MIDIAFSSCPNDTFIFHAMIKKIINTKNYLFKPHISDVEELNKDAFISKFDVTKLSFHAYLLLRNRYSLLNSGAALGFGCGPILVARKNPKHIDTLKIAIPGKLTTANLLLKLWNPNINQVIVTRFDNILKGVQNGNYDAGLIIHEGRFVYPQYNLIKIIDLGEWWDNETGLPIPLGCIAIKKDLPKNEKNDINYILKQSVEYALRNRTDSKKYVKLYSQELDDEVIEKHLRLYVNEFTVQLGEIAHNAISMLEKMAEKKGII